MYCPNCGAQLSEQTNFCPYCGSRLQNATTSISLLNKAVSTAEESNEYNLVLVSRGSCDAVTAGDLLEDVFGYTDAESGNLVSMAPVVVGENLTAEEAATVAQLYTEYGMQVSITDKEDKYVDLTSKAVTSVFDTAGNLLESAAAMIDHAVAVWGDGTGDTVVPAASRLRAAACELGRITGRTWSDDLLDAVFSRFCVGK